MDSERPIEKLLREAAKIRREEAGAPRELHPAYRRLLQEEIRRCYPPRPARRSWWPAFVSLWPRVAWVAAIALALGVTIWLIMPPKTQVAEVALKKESESKTYSTDETRSRELKEMRESEVADKLEPVQAPAAPAAMPAPSEPAPVSEGFATGGAGVYPAVPSARASESPSENAPARYFRTSPPAPTAVPPATVGALADTSTAPGEAARSEENYHYKTERDQAHVSLAARSAKALETRAVGRAGAPSEERLNYGAFLNSAPVSSAAEAITQTATISNQAVFSRNSLARTPVLQRFTVEQFGANFVVNDRDGSQYTGTQQMPRGYPASKQSVAAASASGESEPTQAVTNGTSQLMLGLTGLEFQVSGTNLTSGQFVRFNGRIVTNQVQVQDLEKAKNQAQVQNIPVGVRQILGEAAVDGSHLTIEATEVKE